MPQFELKIGTCKKTLTVSCDIDNLDQFHNEMKVLLDEIPFVNRYDIETAVYYGAMFNPIGKPAIINGRQKITFTRLSSK